MKNKLFIICLLGTGFGQAFAQTLALKISNDSIIYNADNKGNRVLDFSYCGYRNSEADMPLVEGKVFVSHKEGDNSQRIQKAIDYVSSLKPDKNGYRGSIIIDDGVFEIDNSLRIYESGVVLRGKNKKSSIIKKIGTDRGALLYVEGNGKRNVKDTIEIASDYVPVNQMTFKLKNIAGLKPGDNILICRPATTQWIESLGCKSFGGGISALGWKPADLNMRWDRTIKSIDGDVITIDAPLSMALDKNNAASFIVSYEREGFISESGVENITLVSDYDINNKFDEDHCWTGISIDKASDCRIGNVDFYHFAGSSVVIQRDGSRVTVEDCVSYDPVSETGGMRRQTFKTHGELTLFQRCYSYNGVNDFVAAYGASGPNAFVQCESENSSGLSGSVGSWNCGLLFDIVNIGDNDLSFKNLGQDKYGVGWNTANSLFWQCTAAGIDCYSPAEDAVNRAYGCWGQFSGNGEWAESNNHLRPRSFFYYQLSQRISQNDISRSCILPLATNSTSSPTIEQAAIMAAESLKPRLTLTDWIEHINSDKGYVSSAKKILCVDRIKTKSSQTLEGDLSEFAIIDGKFTFNGEIITGSKTDVAWWNGNVKDNAVGKSKVHITRFVPDQEGKGLTDRVDSVICYMKQNNIAVLDHNYGLWYERRRDDHSRVNRKDADVWAPFYEQPFARSGVGKAADGLSKYDLTKPNKWYWSRLKEFAQKGAKEGIVLYHQNYFQHNILEAGAHWVDSPWRTANNINSTGFSEPVNFSGDKRIFVADQFYDITHPGRRELHRNYIRMCLDNFADMPNVVQLISSEYTGPVGFVRFWLDVISEWQQENGKKAVVALSVTKDVQDDILSDKKYSDLISIIDIRYWHYKTDGLYAPEGGKNLAPRQHARKMKVGKVTYREAYKAVSEYRLRYPDKSVTYYGQNYPGVAWGVIMAGGSCADLNVKSKDFLSSISQMSCSNVISDQYDMLVNSDKEYIIYSHTKSDITLDLSPGTYSVSMLNSDTGEVDEIYNKLKINGTYMLDCTNNPHGIFWFKKK